MIPKLYVTKESGYPSSFYPHGVISNGMPNPMVTGFLPNYIPEHVVVRTNGEMDSLLHNHRRKMIRRAANRRSAQQSRARKKTFMEELKVENVRLQNLVDMLDSQPDLVFCVNLEGEITFISEKTKNYVKTDESSEEDPSHMSQILTNESMDALAEALKEVKQQSFNSDNPVDYSRVSAVKEVCFHDSNGYPTVGYLRCSKVVRRPGMDELETNRELESQAAANAIISPLPKTAKKGDEAAVVVNPANSSSKGPTLNCALAVQSLQSFQQEQQKNQFIVEAQFPESNNSTASGSIRHRGHSKFNSGNSESNTSEDSNCKTDSSSNEGQIAVEEFEEEFICVIRPADASISQGASVMFQTYLSTASMVEHDRKRDVGDSHISNNINLADTNRGGSPSCSVSNDSGSDDKFGSGSSGQTGSSSSDLKGIGTSSETGSDESGI